MSKRDYTKYSNDYKPKTYTSPAEVEEAVKENYVESISDVVNNEPSIEEAKPIVGIVVDCDRLNVRAFPSPTAEVVCTIERDSKLSIDESESTDNFYKICAEIGAEGYCMKQFIKIES